MRKRTSPLGGITALTDVPSDTMLRIRFHHGEGGVLARKLIEEVFLDRFRSFPLRRMREAAVLPLPEEGRVTVTTQACVVEPLFYAGGDIGKLAVYRAVNNLAAEGASPRYITAAFVLPDGLRLQVLERIVKSFSIAAAESMVEVVAGDTRIVSADHGENIRITVTAIGIVPEERDLLQTKVRDGDVVLVSGPVAEHGIAVYYSQRGERVPGLRSDGRSLHQIALAAATVEGVRRMKDISRGGLTATLLKLAGDSGVALELEQGDIPLRLEVKQACVENGFDPLAVPSAGVMVAIASPQVAEQVLQKWSRIHGSEEAARIGHVLPVPRGTVSLHTAEGGSQRLEMQTHAPLIQVG